MRYRPIADYGVIGNLRTVALVSKDASIDWFCFPHFDSPSIFGALLDAERGGRFAVSACVEEPNWKQLYWPDTNVLVTRMLAPSGILEIEDFMPVGYDPAFAPADQLVRRVRAVRGSVRVDVTCEPAFDYARERPEIAVQPSGALFTGSKLRLGLASTHPLERTENGVKAVLNLPEGSRATFVLRAVQSPSCGFAPNAEQSQELFEDTVEYWRRWIRHSTYTGRWREMVNRSALILKLLTFEPTGAIVAAPTTSLPETLGGTRNWDYRYTWMRDAAFTLYGLLRIGFSEEAAKFMGWLEERCREAGETGQLQIAYGIDGRRDLHEIELSHLEGWNGHKPVRIGNGAANQLQLDMYGELLDSVYLFNKYGQPISYDLWTQLRQMLNWLASGWNQPDEGIWEVRSGRRHFLYSKLMCWVAFDRGIRLAEKRSFPYQRDAWLHARDEVFEQIMRRGFSEKLGAFVQSFGEEALDASALIMPLVFFISPNDPRMLRTIEAIRRPAREGGLVMDGLVYRYDASRPLADGLTGEEGTFNICTFWLVEALTRAGMRDRRLLDDARLLFERMLGYSNHVGLYSEETGPSGEALGNFPQAFTHLSLISAAFNLDRALGRSSGC